MEQDTGQIQSFTAYSNRNTFFPNKSSALNSLCNNCPLHEENFTLRQQSNYWRGMHQAAIKREIKLKEKILQLQAKLKLRERQLFGRKSEQHKIKQRNPNIYKRSQKSRGQQCGSNGHRRRDYPHLPVIPEIHELPIDKCLCNICGRPFLPFPDDEVSEILEIEVRAYRRRIVRKKYIPACDCGNLPGIITAPPPPKLIPKGIYGISIWVTILLDKFCFLRPTYRLLSDLKTHGLDIAQGTITGGLKAIAPVFKPIYEAIIARNLQEDRWHADETRWRLFIIVDDKVGYKWQMWVVSSPSTVVYILDKSRSAEVPKNHFGDEIKGILVVDRYSAYKSMAKDCDITLAFCWAHVRRDFINLANSWPRLEAWAMEWIESIGILYYLNSQRLEALNDPKEFSRRNHLLETSVEKMEQDWQTTLEDNQIHFAQRKVLKSLKNHWAGLTVFVNHPEVPMDNNTAERLERIPVIGRKNFYGSGSLWSGELTAKLFSIFQTLNIWKINPRAWLTFYLEACALNGGNAPDNIDRFLPWNMSKQEKETFTFDTEIEIKDSS